MKITVFKHIKDKLGCNYVAPEKVIERIKTGKDKDKIEAIRAETDVKKRRAMKENLPCICWSGEFTQRFDENIVKHSGLVCLDFDHLKDVLDKKVEMTFLPYVYAAFTSPSGDGLKVIVRVPAVIKSHRGYYRGLMKVFPELDPTSINESRVCYSSWDENLYFNPQAIEFTDYVAEVDTPKQEPVELSQAGTTNYAKIEVAAKMIRTAPDGTKHITLLKAAKLMGGYISGGMVEEDKAISILEDEISKREIDDFPSAQQAIRSGIEYGKKTPLFELEREIYTTQSKEAVKPADAVWELMKYTFRHGKKRGLTTHFAEFDNNFKWKAGEITLIIGRPNCGKSEFTLHLMLLKSVFHGWKWGVFCPENYPEDEFYDTLIHSYIGKTTDPHYGIAQMTADEYEKGYNFVREHFFYVYPEQHTIEEIDSAMIYLVSEKKICGVFIDPFNQVEADYGARQDLFLSKFLTDRKRFALKYNLYYVISSHPKSMTRNKNGEYDIPDMYDISGGAMWGNKMDNILVLHRPNFLADPSDPTVEIYARKIKKQKLVGIPGMKVFTFSRKANRYYLNDFSPLEPDRVVPFKAPISRLNEPKPKEDYVPF